MFRRHVPLNKYQKDLSRNPILENHPKFATDSKYKRAFPENELFEKALFRIEWTWSGMESSFSQISSSEAKGPHLQIISNLLFHSLASPLVRLRTI